MLTTTLTIMAAFTVTSTLMAMLTMLTEIIRAIITSNTTRISLCIRRRRNIHINIGTPSTPMILVRIRALGRLTFFHVPPLSCVREVLVVEHPTRSMRVKLVRLLPHCCCELDVGPVLAVEGSEVAVAGGELEKATEEAYQYGGA